MYSFVILFIFHSDRQGAKKIENSIKSHNLSSKAPRLPVLQEHALVFIEKLFT